MKKIRLFLCVAGLLCYATVFGQNEKFKALFICNFTNYIDWPGGSGGTFVIAVLGESPIIGELQSAAKYKKVGNSSIEVRKISTAVEIGNAQIVYVPANKKRAMPEISQTVSGKPTLIISDGASSDFGINFIEVDQKQSFQISKNNIEMHRLKVNSTLISLGIPVN